MLSTTSSSSSDEIQGALTLYLDFINLFLNLLQLFGEKKE
jgi:FtsH-binding integral membrane protein